MAKCPSRRGARSVSLHGEWGRLTIEPLSSLLCCATIYSFLIANTTTRNDCVQSLHCITAAGEMSDDDSDERDSRRQGQLLRDCTASSRGKPRWENNFRPLRCTPKATDQTTLTATPVHLHRCCPSHPWSDEKGESLRTGGWVEGDVLATISGELRVLSRTERVTSLSCE